MNNISERIYQAIKYADLSYGELAEKTGIPKSALQRYATGETENIKLDRIEAIAKATGTKAEWIIGWVADQAPPDPADKLTVDEKKLVTSYRAADPKYQELALELLEEHPRR